MSDQDRYIPGVPCWVDTTQPDPEAAVAFYGGLFGWEFEDVMPPDAPQPVLRRAGSAAATSPPSARSRRARRAAPSGTRTCGSRTPTRPPRRCAPPAAPCLMEPVDVGDVRPHGGLRRPGRRRVLRLAGRRAPRRRGRQRARLAELQRPQHARRRGREGVLRRRLRLGAARRRAASRCGRCPATATSSSSATRACARTWPRWARRSASRTSSRAVSRSPTTSPTRRRTGA